MEEKKTTKIGLLSVVLMLIILVLVVSIISLFLENKKLNKQIIDRDDITLSTDNYKIGTIKNIYDIISDNDTQLIKAQKIAKEVMNAVNNKDWYYLAKLVGTDADYFIKYGIYNYTININDYQKINSEYIFKETYETTSSTNESLGNMLIIEFEDGGKIVIDTNCTGV